jgi:predicted ABC-class ATPase
MSSLTPEPIDKMSGGSISSSVQRLRSKLRAIDGRGYKAYLELKGEYQFEDFTVYVDHVQGDPFASPSRVRVRVASAVCGFGEEFFSKATWTLSLEDSLRRGIHRAISLHCRGLRGRGRSGSIPIHPAGQEVLKSSAVVATSEFVEARIFFGLPAHGRRISGNVAEQMFFTELPKIVHSSLILSNLDEGLLERWAALVEDVECIRESLPENGLVAFIGEDSMLPRRSGVDEQPMEGGVPFTSPDSLRVTFTTPNRGTVSGMGIPKGVTLIVGGGYHGKSTLLRALEKGVYVHKPGDGREWVVTNPTAAKIRAEDGRRVEKVDISPFISGLPMGRPTTQFSTDDASGSTSQAANIIEALELGAELLLIDEDTSATNFMIRDRRMQELVTKEKEPIIPFVDQVRRLYEELDVSTILVMGGAGDYLDVADSVIMMDNYRPKDATGRAREVVKNYPTGRLTEASGPFPKLRGRIPLRESMDARRGRKQRKIDTRGLSSILFGRTVIDLSAVEQLVDAGQTRAIGDAIYYLREHQIDGRTGFAQAISFFYDQMEKRGLDILSHPPRGDYVKPRPMELGCAINRLRSLSVR